MALTYLVQGLYAPCAIILDSSKQNINFPFGGIVIMMKLLKRMRLREICLCILCGAGLLSQIYFDLKLPDYMSQLTVLIQTPDSPMSQIWATGGWMLLCSLSSAVLCMLRWFVCGFG